MKNKYKIQLPKGKTLINITKISFKDGFLVIDAEIENEERFVRIATEKLGKVAKKRIKEHDKQIDQILKMADDKDVLTVHNMILQEYGENICAKEQQKYEPKDGDFIFVKSRLRPYVTKYSFIGIFRNIIKDEGCSPILLMYASLKDDNRLAYGNSIEPYNNSEYIRPATEKEKKLLIDKLAVVNKRWNEEKKCLEDVRWRAKKGELYRWVSADGYVKESTDEHGECNNCYYKSGNYFKTEEAAEKVAEQIREIFKNSKAE